MEKSLYNQVGEVKGAPSESEDSFSFQFTPQNENLKRTRGALFTLISVSGKVDNRNEKAKNIYHQFQSSYYAKASGSILHGLSDTLEHLAKTTLKREEEAGLKISIIAAVFWGTVVYLSKYGNGAVYVARGDKVKRLEFAKVASGVLEDQDTVCLASESFGEKVAVEDLSEVLTKEEFEKTLETLDKRIADIEGAVCDVVRLSVNAPKEPTESLAIAEVGEDGKIEEQLKEEQEQEQEAEEAPVQETKEITPEQETQENALEEKEIEKETPQENLTPDPFDRPISGKTNRIAPLLNQAKVVFNKAVVTILKPWRKPPVAEHYDPVAIRRARIIQIIALILIILVLSIVFGVFSRSTEEKNNQLGEKITAIETALNEAANIKVIDPNRALALVAEAQKDIAEAKKIDDKDQKLSQLSDRSSDLKAEITKTTSIENLQTHTDFDNLNKGSSVGSVALLSETLLVVDPNKGVLYSGSTSDSSTSQVSEGVGDPKIVTSSQSWFYLITQNSISKVDTSLKVSNASSGSNWGKIVDSATFRDNLYLLDSSKNEIWLYRYTSSGLGTARAYISGEKPNLSDAVAIAIDDIVWVATRGGTVYKIASGKLQENFVINGLADPIGELSDLFTSSSTVNHYFLDKGKARIIVVDKKGNYQEAFTHEKLHEANSLVVDESQKTVYFTSGNKLYQFALP